MKERMKRGIRSFLIGSACFFTAVLSAQAAEYVSVVKDGVNVRTGPGTNNPVYMELFQGYPLIVLEKKGEWLKVQDFENDTGWVFSSLVEKGNSAIVIAQSKANMRSGPGTKNNVVASIERGVVLKVIARKNKWVNVSHSSGTEGWIYAPLLWP